MRVFQVSEAPLVYDEVQLLSIELPKARSATQPLGCIISRFTKLYIFNPKNLAKLKFLLDQVFNSSVRFSQDTSVLDKDS